MHAASVPRPNVLSHSVTVARKAFKPRKDLGVAGAAPAAAKARRKTERDLQEENGGAGVYNADLRKLYALQNEAWKYDIMPEIMDGHNVADFVDAEIEEKLAELEREEEVLEVRSVYLHLLVALCFHFVGGFVMCTDQMRNFTPLWHPNAVLLCLLVLWPWASRSCSLKQSAEAVVLFLVHCSSTACTGVAGQGRMRHVVN